MTDDKAALGGVEHPYRHKWGPTSYNGVPCDHCLRCGILRNMNGSNDSAICRVAVESAALLPAQRGEGDDVERVAQIVYEAMRYAVAEMPRPGRVAPAWQAGGNSFAQDRARDAARAIAALPRNLAYADGEGR